MRAACRLGAVVVLGAAAWLRAAQISDVVVRCTVPDLEPESLRQLVVGSIQSTPGSTFDAATLAEDVKRLYRLGAFQDVRYEVEEQAGDRVLIIFQVKPTPSVNKVVFEGNAAYKDKRLRSLIEHKEGVPLDESQVAKDRAALVDRYEDGGYHGTTIATEYRPVGDTNAVDLVFRIQEAPRAKLKGVAFVGNTAFGERELSKTVRSRRQWWRYIFRFGNYYNEPQTALDRDLLRDLYLTKGYLDFAVDRVETQYNASRKWVTLVFQLNEGQPYAVSAVAVAVEGDRFKEPDLLPLVAMKAGQAYSSTTEQADVTALRGKYEPLGYLDLRCVADLERNAAAHTVAVTYRLREGGPSRIRDVHILGNEVTRDHVIRRELAIHPGDLSDASKIRVSKDRLTQLNYFETVDISPVATQREDLKDLRIQLSEKRTGTFTVGAGFSTEDAVVGYIELAENNFDLSRLFGEWPPKGGGQRMRLRTSVGTRTSDFRVDFTEPWFLQRRLRLDVELFNSTRSFDEYDQSDIGLGVTLSRPLRTYWRTSYGVLLDRVTLDDFDRPPLVPDYNDPDIIYTWPDVPLREDRTLIDEEGSYWANRFTFGVARDSRDTVLFPHKGSRLSVNTELVTSLLGSYADVVRVDTRAAKFVPVFKQSVLRLNAEAAVAQDVAGDEVAIFDRYFAGGPSTLRGFDYREVGPVDAGENPVGGKSRLLGSIELAREVADALYLYTFMDAGNVWESSFGFDPSEINASVGVGLQLKVLPVRLEYGFPVLTDWDHLDGGGRFHFNIGYSF
jgi:outer membrane protein insertion porin family